jgi:hypothetical protein
MQKNVFSAISHRFHLARVIGPLLAFVALSGTVVAAPPLNHTAPYCYPGERCAENKPSGFIISLPWGSTTEEVSFEVAAGHVSAHPNHDPIRRRFQEVQIQQLVG